VLVVRTGRGIKLMKLKFTGKLILDSVEMINGIKVIRFASFLKEDYIERLVKISIKNSNAVTIYFSSNSYGTATWMKGKGFVESRRWEVEDDLKDISYLAKHYPALLENGMVSEDYAFDKIVPDVLDNMIDSDLSSDLYKVFNSSDGEVILNWEEIINRNKKLSNDFIDNLILKYEREIGKNELLKVKPEKSVVPEIKKSAVKKEVFKTTIVNYLNSTAEYLISNYNKIKVILINHKAEYSDDNIKTGPGKSGDVNDIHDYIERAKKLSRKIKKF